MNKLKKTILLSFVLLCIFTYKYTYAVDLYSTDEYKIYIPSNFSEVNTNLFSDENGNTVNIQMQSFNGSSDDIVYSTENLNELSETLESNMKKALLKQLKGTLPEDEVDSLVDSMIVQQSLKEITTFTTNNYKCFHFSWIISTSGESAVYEEQYYVWSRKYSFCINIRFS